MRILDLYCGAGGAAMGYHLTGFEVVGVDVEEQKNYPFEFYQNDALAHLRDYKDAIEEEFDAIHASPPCQAHSRTQKLRKIEYPKLIEPTRELLELMGLPYVIENVDGAPLIDPVTLTGQMFSGLRTSRPRLFETNWPLIAPPENRTAPKHTKMGRPVKPGEWMHVVGNFSNAGDCTAAEAMGIDWMTRAEIAEAIPPAYTVYVGNQLKNYIHALRYADVPRYGAWAGCEAPH